MDEKVLVKSQSYNVKKLFIILLAIGLAASLIWGMVQITDYTNSYNLEYVEREHEHGKWCFKFEYRFDKTWSDYDLDEVDEEKLHELLECPPIRNGNAMSYAIEETFEEFYIWMLPLAAMIVIGGLLFLWLRSYELTVTDKRVYGKVAWGKRVDLPVDSVSATATISLFKGVSVSTSSGKISFLAIKNANEIYEAVSKLLVERQQENKTAVVATTAPAATDEAEQLQKFKKLLDDGVITQEEFDAKKKQILGL